jgi:trimeric autotransporter adhesin
MNNTEVSADGAKSINVADGIPPRSRSARMRVATLLAAAGMLSVGLSAATPNLPQGGQLTQGAGTIAATASTTTITQNTQVMGVSWQSFNIGVGNTVQFVQPDSQSVAINRVVGNDRSEIYGNLKANGQVFLLNPNGVLFGKDAQVDVAGLVASTARSATRDASGVWSMTDKGDGTIVNQGHIRAQDGGFVVLDSAREVVNTGSVRANLAGVALTVGKTTTISLDGSGLLNVAVEGDVLQALVDNHGLIISDGGSVFLTAKGQSLLQASIVNLSGVVQAKTLSKRNGRIFLSGGSAGSVAVTGGIDASGVGQGETGGTVDVSGASVAMKNAKVEVRGDVVGGSIRVDSAVSTKLTDTQLSADSLGMGVGASAGSIRVGGVSVELVNSQLSASGEAGKGHVQVGGGFQGASVGGLTTATRVVIDATSLIDVSSTGAGDGGTAIVWSDGLTRFSGKIDGRALDAVLGGDGGFAEVSGKQQLDYAGRVDMRAANPLGKFGDLLLDPYDITISSGATTTGTGPGFVAGTDNSVINVVDLVAALATSNVSITTSTVSGGQLGNLTISAPITWTTNSHLTLTAVRMLSVQASITNDVSSSASLRLISFGGASGGISGTGNIRVKNVFFNNGSTNAFIYSGVISDPTSGAASFNKGGSGQVILTGTHTYTGTTTIREGGSLRVGNGGTVGSIQGSSLVQFADNSTLIVDRSDSYGVSAILPSVVGGSTATTGSGNVTLMSTGSITLDRSINLTGNTVGGIIKIYPNGGIGTDLVDPAKVATLGNGVFIEAPATGKIFALNLIGVNATNGITIPGNASGLRTIETHATSTTSATMEADVEMKPGVLYRGDATGVVTTLVITNPANSYTTRVYDGTNIVPFTASISVWDPVASAYGNPFSTSLSVTLPSKNATGVAQTVSLTIPNTLSWMTGDVIFKGPVAFGAGSATQLPETITITKKPLSFASTALNAKGYDGSTTTLGGFAYAFASGVVVTGDVVTASVTGVLGSRNAGTTTATGLSYALGGADGSNYDLTPGPGSMQQTINQRSLTVTGGTLASRVYDGTSNLGGFTGVTFAAGRIGADVITVNAVGLIPSGGKDVGTYNGITGVLYVLGGDLTSQNYVLSSTAAPSTLTQVVTAKALSITAPTIAAKIYDGNTTAGALTLGTLSGLVGTETLGVTGLAGALSSKDAGARTATVSYTLANGTNGGLGANYTLAANTNVTATVNAKALTITAPTIAAKTYDGNTTAGILTLGTLSGLVGTETLGVTGLAGALSSKDAGVRTATVNYTLANGTNGGLGANYTLAANTNVTATVNTKALTITAPTIAAKTYDGTTTAGILTLGTLSGFVGTETLGVTGLAGALSSKDAGARTATVSYTLANGTNGGLGANYTLAANTNVTATVNAKALSITAPTIAAKTYDGNTTAGAVTLGTLSGFVGTETLGVTGLASALSSKDAGARTATVSYTLANGTNGGLGANYTLAANTNVTATVNTKALTITAPTIAAKTYDGTTTAGAVTLGTLSGLVGTETLGVTGLAGALSSKDAGARTTTVSYTLADGTNGGLGANYTLAANTNVTATVNAKALTITGTSLASKVYDGTTTPGDLTLGTLSGFVETETVSVSATVGELSGSSVGTQTAVVTYSLLDGVNGLAANYSLANETLMSAITSIYDSSFALQTAESLQGSSTEYQAESQRLEAISVDFSEFNKELDIENFRMWRRKK